MLERQFEMDEDLDCEVDGVEKSTVGGWRMRMRMGGKRNGDEQRALFVKARGCWCSAEASAERARDFRLGQNMGPFPALEQWPKACRRKQTEAAQRNGLQRRRITRGWLGRRKRWDGEREDNRLCCDCGKEKWQECR